MLRSFREGGFDVVIGNPPYVRQEGLKSSKAISRSIYQVYHGNEQTSTHTLLNEAYLLLKETGICSYIVANKWMRANYGQPMREFLG